MQHPQKINAYSAQKPRARTGCKACAADYQADNLKHAIARLNGVSSMKVDEVTGKVVVEFDDVKISLSKITQRMEKLGYHVEVVKTEEAK